MKLKHILGIIIFPAFLYLLLIHRLLVELKVRMKVKELAKSKRPKDRLIRLLVYKIFGM